MKACVAATVYLSAMLLCGCLPIAPGGASSETQPPAEYRRGSKVLLGSPSLTAGIPGNGPLTNNEIRQWLAREEVHRPLDFALPWPFSGAEHLISIPADNPLTRAKIELGRQLFFDSRLSEFGSFACATCHKPQQHYSAYMVMPDIERNPGVSFNRIFSQHQFWDGRAESLEEHPGDPISNAHEMNSTVASCVARLQAIEGYRLQFDVIFGRLDIEAVGFALASFQRALLTGPSAWDYWRLLHEEESDGAAALSHQQRPWGKQHQPEADIPAMSAAAGRGAALFFSDRTRCSWCHSGPNFTDEEYHNIGIGMDQQTPDAGRFAVTGNPDDFGAFKTPTLRNVANTPPYMHNGQFSTLAQVVTWFNRGGFAHSRLDRSLRPLNLTNEEQRELVAFLNSLSGSLPPVETGRIPP